MLHDLATFYASHSGLFLGSVFVLGLVVGSFLNVVIHRLPIMLERQWQAQAADLLPSSPMADTIVATDPAPRYSLSVPRSACPICKAPISALHNIPLLSWLMLRGRCAACRAPISWRYPVVELATAVLSVAVAWHFGVSVAASCGLVLTWALVALTGIDIDHQLLPDDITLPVLWAALLAAVVWGSGGAYSFPVPASTAIIGAIAGYMSLWSVFHLFRWVTGKEGMGYGDFKLFAALGAWLGWKLLPLIILLAAASGALIGIAMILLKGRDRAAPMPFGPYLAIAGWLAMMYGEDLVTGYMRMTGLRP